MFRGQLAKAEQVADEATIRAERAESAVGQARAGPDHVESVRVELQAALSRIDVLSKSLADQSLQTSQTMERASALEDDIRVRSSAHAVCVVLTTTP